MNKLKLLLTNHGVPFQILDDVIVTSKISIRILDVNNVNNYSQKWQTNEPFMVWSSEWETRQTQCWGFIKSILGLNQKIYARKCHVKQINKLDASRFFEQYHIQGSNKLGIVFFGLFYANELVGAVSLGRHNRNIAANRIVLDRLCFKDGLQIIGGASKLFACCKEWAKYNNYEEIISFSDNRWSRGTVYEKMGFQLEKNHKPDYVYVKNGRLFSKQSQQKKSCGCPSHLTELDWAKQRGMFRIFDYGKKRWAYYLTNKITWKQALSQKCVLQHQKGVLKGNHLNGYFFSIKSQANIFFSSSYELRCLFLLEQDENVKKVARCEGFATAKQSHIPDFLVEYIDNSKSIIEVKPERRLAESQTQIQNSLLFAQKQGYTYKIWTEKDSGLSGEKAITQWALDYLDAMHNGNYNEIRKQNNRLKGQRHYEKKIATTKTTIWCSFCQQEHVILTLSYNKNIAKNGRYICIKENGFLIGKKGKKKIQIIDDCKKCSCCQKMLPLTSFNKDKTRRCGYSSRCRDCRKTNNK